MSSPHKGPSFEFVEAADFDPAYPYHVLVCGRIVLKSRDAFKARAVAECVAGQFWRTPVVPDYPAFCLCDFEVERWRLSA